MTSPSPATKQTTSPDHPGPEQRARARQIRTLFGAIAGPYDTFNHIFSLGQDYLWRRRLRRLTLARKPQLILDLATGSGDVAIGLEKDGARVIGSDFCLPMLEKARQKGAPPLACADALHMPFPDGCCDAITIAFGFRNLTDRPAALAEMKRLLQPGGWLHILEFSKPGLLMRPFYHIHLGFIMPLATGALTGQGNAYQYLNDSVRAFPDQKTLASMLEGSGMENVRWENLTFGIVAIHSAQKPQAVRP